MRSGLPSVGRRFTGVVLTSLLLFSCGSDSDSTEESGGSSSVTEVEDVIRKSLKAESDNDPKGFAALWTDQGLEQYDVGSREDLESGKSENFGQEKITLVGFAETTVTGDKADSTVDVVSGEHKVAEPIYRAKLAAIKTKGAWKLDGFEFVGSPPPAAGVAILKVDAPDYAFVLDRTEVPGNVGFKFNNVGKEPHEMALFKGPSGVDVATAKAALEKVNGQEFDNVPAGYEADHIAFAEPGNSYDVTFAKPIAPGNYFMACFLPQGGFTDEGEPVNPQGDPHISLGMISRFTVR